MSAAVPTPYDCAVISRDPWRAIAVHRLIVTQMCRRRVAGYVAGSHRQHRYIVPDGRSQRHAVGTVFIGRLTGHLYRQQPRGFRPRVRMLQPYPFVPLSGQGKHRMGNARAPFRWLLALAQDENWPGATA